MEDALILITEATTMRNAIKAATNMGFKNIIVEGDNKIVIQSIQGEVQVPWRIQAIIQHIRIFI